MAGFDEMMSQMRHMQNEMNRVMLRAQQQAAAVGGASSGSAATPTMRDPFNTMALMDRDPFFSGNNALALQAPSATTGAPTCLAIPEPLMAGRDLMNGANLLDSYKPHMDVLDVGDHFAVHADLPGMDKQDIKVEVKDGVLNIAAEHREDKKRTEGNWVVQERRYGKFKRTLKLPENVKEEGIRAKFNEGVLELDLPKIVPDNKNMGKMIDIQ